MTPTVVYNALNVRPHVDDGAATFSVNVLRHLPDVLPDVQIVAYVQQGEHRVARAENLRVVTVRGGGGVSRVVHDLFVLRRGLLELGAALLVCPFESLPVRLPCPAVVVAQNILYHCETEARYRGLPLREQFFGLARDRYYGRRMPAAYRRAARVIVVSSALATTLTAKAGLPAAKAEIVLEGADSVLLPPPSIEAVREPILLTVGSIAPYKDLERLVDLFALVRSGIPELRLVIAGPDWRGFSRVLEGYIASRGLSDVVELTGGVSGEGLARLYEQSRLLVLLSRCESFGLPVLEAMRYGLPVAVADRGALGEVVSGAGLLFDPDGSDAPERLRVLLADDAELSRLAGAGRMRAASLTWRRTAEGIGAVVRATLDAGG